MIDYKKAYEGYRDYQKKEHEKNQKRIRVGLKVNIILPLIFLILCFLTSGSKLIFLILWIVSLFGIAGYLMYVEYMDHLLSKKLSEFSGVEEDEEGNELIDTHIDRVEKHMPQKAGIGRIFLSDLRHISTNVVAVVVVIGLSVIPCLYAWFNILSNWAPYETDATSRLSVAIASEDRGRDLGDIKINIGNMVVDNLRSNKSINWVFTDTSHEAIRLVESGDVYAALVIDQPFSEDMLSFIGGEPEHPTITYYENEKKNAIAPKITGKVKDTVQKEVNAAFVSTLAKTMAEASAYIAKSPGYAGGIGDSVSERLRGLSDDLDMAVKLIDSIESFMDTSESMMAVTKGLSGELDAIKDTSATMMDGAGAAAQTAENGALLASDMFVMSFDNIDNELENFEEVVKLLVRTNERNGEAVASAARNAAEKVKDMHRDFDKRTKPLYKRFNSTIDEDIAAIDNYYNNIYSNLKSMESAGDLASRDAGVILDELLTGIGDCRDGINDLKIDYVYTVHPRLRESMDEVKSSIYEVKQLLSYSGGGIKELSDILESYPDVLNLGRENLDATKASVKGMQKDLNSLIKEIGSLEENEKYNKVMELIKTDPGILSDFISSPVKLAQREIYPIENNGSATAPFYIVLSIWVGALIMVAIIHTEVKEEDFTDMHLFQRYFGRYIIFFLTGQLQTLITVLGALYFVGIQCQHKFYFWLACAVTSFVFTLLLYSLAFAFEALGEALAVVLMVVQVAGSGGTFPIQVLPVVYQLLYKYMPFAYSMNAIRETVAGFHGNDYWVFLSGHLIYVGASLVIGLLLAGPARLILSVIERSKKQLDLMA